VSLLEEDGGGDRGDVVEVDGRSGGWWRIVICAGYDEFSTKPPHPDECPADISSHSL
jgi:hypothetical protein